MMVSDPNISSGFSTSRREVITVKSRLISHATSHKSSRMKNTHDSRPFPTKVQKQHVGFKKFCGHSCWFLSLYCEDRAN